jgi:hypothetical protein
MPPLKENDDGKYDDGKYDDPSQASCYRTRVVGPKVAGSLPFGGHSEYASGEERILVRGWLHLAAGVGIFGLLFYNWEWASSLPAPLLLLLISDCLKGSASGMLHVLVPPHAPLFVLFAVHFLDIVVIVVSMMAAAMAFAHSSEWGPFIAIGAVGSVIVGLCEVPLWHLKLMRPPGKEHCSVKVRYATMLTLALVAQYTIWVAVQQQQQAAGSGGSGGAMSTAYWMQFTLCAFGFHSTVRASVRARVRVRASVLFLVPLCERRTRLHFTFSSERLLAGPIHPSAQRKKERKKERMND